MFSKACEYGIRACVVVAQYSLRGDRISLKYIAKAINSPEAFTAKILQNLVRNDIMNSVQGAQGGFEISTKHLENITLEKIVEAIDGDEKYMSCVLGLKGCSDENPCPAHKKYKYIKSDLIDMLRTTTLAEMVDDIDQGLAYLKIQ